MAAPSAPPILSSKQPIASVKHTMVTVAILLGMAAAGAWQTSRQAASASAAAGPHSDATYLYLFLTATEWALVWLVYGGIHDRGIRLRDLIGGRWNSPLAVLRDFAIAGIFWLVWQYSGELVQNWLHASRSASVAAMLPTSVHEKAAWLLLALSAGFCEEIVFRGYLQRQFTAFTHSAVLGLIVQAIIFGVGHLYQGWKLAVVITVYGLLYGLLVLGQRHLRSAMLAHAWADIIILLPSR